MASHLISTIYSTLFFVLSAAMFIVLIPQKEEYSDYKKARRIMGAAFAMIGILGLYRSLVTHQPSAVYFMFCIMNLICLTFSSLNFLGFLYISETSNAHIKKVIKACIAAGVVTGIFSVAGFIYKDFQTISKIAGNAIYLITTCYLFYHSIIEYRKCIKRLNDYYSDERWDISWMHLLLWLTFILAVIMIGAFWIRDMRPYIGFAAMLFYTYMTFKVLSFVPATIDKVRHETSLAETEEEEKKIEQELTPSQYAIKEYSRKIEPQIKAWIQSEHYMRPNITIRDVAAEIGTNHNYLSTYLNKILNTSFTTWLNTLRIEKSKEYIESEERISIEECGARVGIPESYNFSRWFKTVTGVSPIQYRKNLKLK